MYNYKENYWHIISPNTLKYICESNWYNKRNIDDQECLKERKLDIILYGTKLICITKLTFIKFSILF